MHAIQIETTWWLVVDGVRRPRYLIHEMPAVNRATRETHVMHRVQRWMLDKTQRQTVHWADGLVAAMAWIEEKERDRDPDGYWKGPPKTGP